MGYLARRLITFPLVMLGASVVVFLAIRLVPGDAITAMLGTEAGLLTDQQRAALAAYFGIDRSWLAQYGTELLDNLSRNIDLAAPQHHLLFL